MRAIAPCEYKEYEDYAASGTCSAVYPLSVVQGCQSGDIFVNDGTAALVWHYCGFALVLGEYDDAFLEEVYGLMTDKTNTRRFVLFADDERMVEFFGSKADILTERRSFFEYIHDDSKTVFELPEGYELKEIDSEIISRMKGRITPAFSWSNTDEFLNKGKGYCVMHGGEPAAWAFSSAVSDKEIDIGVETNEGYRKRGLAFAAAQMMVRYVLGENKRPVWACHSENIASEKLAQKLGFEKAYECRTIRIK